MTGKKKVPLTFIRKTKEKDGSKTTEEEEVER